GGAAFPFVVGIAELESVGQCGNAGERTRTKQDPGLFHVAPAQLMHGTRLVRNYGIDELLLGSDKGVRHLLPERPGGCFAQKVPDPFFATEEAELEESHPDKHQSSCPSQNEN